VRQLRSRGSALPRKDLLGHVLNGADILERAVLSADRTGDHVKTFDRIVGHQKPVVIRGFFTIPRPRKKPKIPLAKRHGLDSAIGVIRRGLLTPASRKELIELAWDASAAHCLARRANALLSLDDGMSCERLGKSCMWTMTRSALGISGMRQKG
jgi:hypothetical protein